MKDAAGYTDAEIRAALLPRLREYCAPGERIIQEWAVGRSRIDLAKLGESSIHGYEIKSARDSVTRLEQQARDYSTVFSTVVLCAHWSHIKRARAIVPTWWGLSTVLGNLPTVEPAFATERAPQSNPFVNMKALAQLLWHREMRALMQRRCLDWRTFRSKQQMAKCLAAHSGPSTMTRDVVRFLHARTDWKDVNDGRAGSRWAL